jgi:hypothetical protein
MSSVVFGIPMPKRVIALSRKHLADIAVVIGLATLVGLGTLLEVVGLSSDAFQTRMLTSNAPRPYSETARQIER